MLRDEYIHKLNSRSMVVRLLIIIGLLQIIFITSRAQDKVFYFRAGASLLVAENKPGGDLIFFPGFTFALGLRIMNGDNFALSLSSPVSVGWSGRSLNYFGFDAPLMFDISLGSSAGNPDKSNFGVIMGAGMAYLYAENVTTDYITNLQRFSSADFFGPRFQFGFSFKKQEDNSAPIILFSYGRSMTSTGHGFGRGSLGPGHIWGVSIQMVMGRKKKEVIEATPRY